MKETARSWLGIGAIGAVALACRGEPPTPDAPAGVDGSGRAGRASFGGATGERRGAETGSASHELRGSEGSEGAETTRGASPMPAPADPSLDGANAGGASNARRLGDGGATHGGATAAAPREVDTDIDTGLGGSSGTGGIGGSSAGTGGDDEGAPAADGEQRYARVDPDRAAVKRRGWR